MIVLRAMSSYVNYALEKAEAEGFQTLFGDTAAEIMKAYDDAGEDAR
jgi:hypothetical protein